MNFTSVHDMWAKYQMNLCKQCCGLWLTFYQLVFFAHLSFASRKTSKANDPAKEIGDHLDNDVGPFFVRELLFAIFVVEYIFTACKNTTKSIISFLLRLLWLWLWPSWTWGESNGWLVVEIGAAHHLHQFHTNYQVANLDLPKRCLV